MNGFDVLLLGVIVAGGVGATALLDHDWQMGVVFLAIAIALIVILAASGELT